MRLASEANLADIASVPLFVKYPGQRTGRADRRDAHLTDVLPTIADVIGRRAARGRSTAARSSARPVRRGGPRRDTGRGERQRLARLPSIRPRSRRRRRNASLFGEGPRLALPARPARRACSAAPSIDWTGERPRARRSGSPSARLSRTSTFARGRSPRTSWVRSTSPTRRPNGTCDRGERRGSRR